MPYAAKMLCTNQLTRPRERRTESPLPPAGLIERYSAKLCSAMNPVTWIDMRDISTNGHARGGFEDGRATNPDGREYELLMVANMFENSYMYSVDLLGTSLNLLESITRP